MIGLRRQRWYLVSKRGKMFMEYQENQGGRADDRKFTALDYFGIAFAVAGLFLFCYYGLWT
jgi:hypothetical protein